MPHRLSAIALLLLAPALLAGCEIGQLIGGMLQNEEYQRKITVPTEYEGLADRTTAVVVVADLSTLYEHPDLTAKIAGGVSARLAHHVPGLANRVLDPRIVVNWQYRTPQWDAMPYGEIAEQLDVDRVIHIDLYEYRLNPPGNYWLWEGVCAASVGIIERDGIDPDSFADLFTVSAEFPALRGLGRDSANARQIETGLLAEFIKKTAWLFYTHEEPKYPDKYRPELDRS
jgi:hypothetical protein